MSDLLEVLFSQPKLLAILILAIAAGWLVGAWFGFTAGLVAFGLSFVVFGVVIVVRSLRPR
ncbi:hypothetical protein [Phreatobacter sp.]|uniref:hypothetical protein n=1 Tax=Phreatobacter sp. TaxID=1966341 RepID=UPI0022C9EDF7|nr:hypothetical protein [Phreatobacter sp.]MCZ8314553.1 hypothetical protein [Phreatobacter sp.]